MQNRLILGDNQIVLPGIATNSVDLTISSPPYHLQRKYNGHGSGNEESLEAYFANVESVFAECLRITRPTGTVIFNLGDQWRKGGQLLLPYRFAIRVIERFKVTLVNDVTWIKTNPNPFLSKHWKWLTNCTEQFLIFSKDKNYYFDPQPFRDHKSSARSVTSGGLGEHYRKCFAESNLTQIERYNGIRDLETLLAQVRDGMIEGFRITIRGVHALRQHHTADRPTRDMMDKGYHVMRLYGVPMAKNIVSCPLNRLKGGDHPAIFPVELIEKFINGFCKTGGLVFDPYMGTGSTALAALNTGRTYLGVEIDCKYYRNSAQTLSSYHCLAK